MDQLNVLSSRRKIVEKSKHSAQITINRVGQLEALFFVFPNVNVSAMDNIREG